MTHPYHHERKRAAFEAWALSYGHDLTDLKFYAAAFAGYLAGVAEVERAVAAEQTRIVALIQEFPHWLGPQAKWDLVVAIRKGADDATGT